VGDREGVQDVIGLPSPRFHVGPVLGAKEEEAILRVLRSGHLASGAEVDAFEAEFASYVQTQSAVAASSGTAALVLALHSLGIGREDEVIVPALTFVATANAVIALGARPVFADVDPRTFTIDPEVVKVLITPRTRAVIVVHLYGLPVDLPRLTRVCLDFDLALIEDAAQAHGASWGGKPVGSWGTGAFSFYPTKNMTTGEGGMLTTADDEVARRARSFANHGRPSGASHLYTHPQFGLNYRLTDLAAAIGRVQLRRLPGAIRARQTLSSKLRQLFPEECTQRVPAPAEHANHLFPLILDDPQALATRLQRVGVPTGVYYPAPVYRMAPHLPSGDCPVADRLCEQLLCLRLGGFCSATQDQYVEAVAKAAL
jgi:perosamine synthetase